MTCACMLRLFRVERCADGAPWALWMCDVVGRGWRVCERRAWFAGMVVVCVTFAWNTWARLWTPRLVCWDGRGVCYVCVEYVDAFVDTAPGLPG